MQDTQQVVEAPPRIVPNGDGWGNVVPLNKQVTEDLEVPETSRKNRKQEPLPPRKSRNSERDSAIVQDWREHGTKHGDGTMTRQNIADAHHLQYRRAAQVIQAYEENALILAPSPQ